MSYTPPANNAVDFDLKAYTAPANDSVNFDITGFTGFIGVGSHSQPRQTSQAAGVYETLNGAANHAQPRQTSAGTGDNNSIPIVVVDTGGSRRRRQRIIVSGSGYSYQPKQKQWFFGLYVIKAFSAMWQKKSHSKAAGGMQIIGKVENQRLRQIEKCNGFTVNAEDELITILKLLNVA